MNSKVNKLIEMYCDWERLRKEPDLLENRMKHVWYSLTPEEDAELEREVSFHYAFNWAQ